MKKLLFLALMSLFLSACGDRLSADEISKMTEEQIKKVTAEQIGNMTPGELDLFKNRRSSFVWERSRAEMRNAMKKSGSERLKEMGM